MLGGRTVELEVLNHKEEGAVVGRGSPAGEAVLGERSRRSTIWTALLEAGEPRGVQPRLLRELEIYGEG